MADEFDPSTIDEASYEDLGVNDWPDDRLPPGLSEAQLALAWSVSTRTLQRWRAAGTGPAWMRIGKRVVYRRSDVQAFEAARLNDPDR